MEYSGLITALITPFKEGQVDEKALSQLINFQLQHEVKALLVLGSTGEGNSLNEKEQACVIELAASMGAGKTKLIVCCGGVSTEEVTQKAIRAEKRGADALLLTSPYYCRPTQEGLRLHFERVAKAVSLPIILYNHPKRCGVEIGIETLKKLSTCSQIIGIKDASNDLSYAAALIHELPSLHLFAGDDVAALPLLAIGAKGLFSVLSNLKPSRMKELASQREPSLFRALYPLMVLTQLESNPISIKAMMNHHGLPAGELRLPLTPLSESNHTLLTEVMHQYG